MKSKAIKWLNELITEETTKAELDIIAFCKKCVNEFKVEKKDSAKEEYINQLFAKFYAVYKRKGGKVQALKTFKKKLIKLKTNEEILEKARKIAKLYAEQQRLWELYQTDINYIPMCSSWLNKNIPD